MYFQDIWLRDGAISHNWPQIASNAQFDENCIIHKKMLNSSKVNNEFYRYLDIFPILMLFKVIYHHKKPLQDIWNNWVAILISEKAGLGKHLHEISKFLDSET